MPEKRARQRAEEDKREGKSPSTQAGEFVREEIHHVREGKHGVKSPKQAIAIGLSKARRAGVALKPTKKASPATREQAKRDVQRGRSASSPRPSPRRSRATTRALEREGSAGASTEALSKQARTAAKKRTPADRSAAAKKAAQTKTPAVRKAAAKKAAATRKRRSAAPPQSAQ
jgi:uncharacterized protein DUF6496